MDESKVRLFRAQSIGGAEYIPDKKDIRGFLMKGKSMHDRINNADENGEYNFDGKIGQIDNVNFEDEKGESVSRSYQEFVKDGKPRTYRLTEEIIERF